MGTTTAQKLKIRPGATLLTIHAPADFEKGLQPLPSSVTVSASSKTFQQIHWFVLNKAQLEKETNKVLRLLKDDVTVWVYYPKGTSRIQTDLTRDKGWDCLVAESARLSWISLLSFDSTWSVFGFRPKTGADIKKEARPVVREIFQWVNPATKEVRLPDDVIRAFKQNKVAAKFFETLNFSNKKEYLEWIVTAKREETRKARISGTIEKLSGGLKNPSDR